MKLYIRLPRKKKETSFDYSIQPNMAAESHPNTARKKKLRPEFNSLFRTCQEMHYKALQPSPLHFNPGASHFQQVLLLPKKERKSMSFSNKEGNRNADQANIQSRREVYSHPKSHSRPHIFSHTRFYRLHENRKMVSNCVSLELSIVCLAEEDSKLLFLPWLSSEDQATYFFLPLMNNM